MIEMMQKIGFSNENTIITLETAWFHLIPTIYYRLCTVKSIHDSRLYPIVNVLMCLRWKGLPTCPSLNAFGRTQSSNVLRLGQRKWVQLEQARRQTLWIGYREREIER
jgi:hypothetical protein